MRVAGTESKGKDNKRIRIEVVDREGGDGMSTDHLIGLLLGAEEDWPRAFEAILRRVGPITDGRRRDPHGRHASGSPSSRSASTTRCAPSWSSTGSRTGTTTRASG